jgi:RimJ/RimL family protein N-acetyltransferase
LTAGDVPALYAVFADEEVNRYWDGWRMASIADADWGKGLAGDAASTLIRFAFQELGLQRIE